ncbi:sigma-54-dependent Fis family transcriptional regulator, partial [Pseudomonas sp.]|uniref:sigma-54-dependent Fis family transcriptional regulator n=1 Tax=Pseudomonas sp. TaxID=306 RepID=UPI002583C9FD
MSIDNQIQVVLIDDDPHLRQALCQTLDLAGLKVLPLGEATGLTAQLSRDWPGVVVSDIRMPGMDGLELLAELHGQDPELPVLLITGHGDVPLAVQAMRAGAYDFLEKPFASDALLDSVRRALPPGQTPEPCRQEYPLLTPPIIHDLIHRTLGLDHPHTHWWIDLVTVLVLVVAPAWTAWLAIRSGLRWAAARRPWPDTQQRDDPCPAAHRPRTTAAPLPPATPARCAASRSTTSSSSTRSASAPP